MHSLPDALYLLHCTSFFSALQKEKKRKEEGREFIEKHAGLI